MRTQSPKRKNLGNIDQLSQKSSKDGIDTTDIFERDEDATDINISQSLGFGKKKIPSDIESKAQ